MLPTIDEISSAFPDKASYNGPVTGIGPEIIDIERALRGRSWPEVDAETCNQHSDTLTFMDIGALAYFIPAFLLTALAQPTGQAAEALVYFVCGARYDAMGQILNLTQQKAILAVVNRVLDNDHGFFADQTSDFLRRVEDLTVREAEGGA